MFPDGIDGPTVGTAVAAGGDVGADVPGRAGPAVPPGEPDPAEVGPAAVPGRAGPAAGFGVDADAVGLGAALATNSVTDGGRVAPPDRADAVGAVDENPADGGTTAVDVGLAPAVDAVDESPADGGTTAVDVGLAPAVDAVVLVSEVPVIPPDACGAGAAVQPPASVSTAAAKVVAMTERADRPGPDIRSSFPDGV